MPPVHILGGVASLLISARLVKVRPLQQSQLDQPVQLTTGVWCANTPGKTTGGTLHRCSPIILTGA